MFQKTSPVISLMKKLSLVLFDVLFIGALIFLISIATRAANQDIRLKTSINDVLYTSGESIEVTFSLENYTGDTLSLTFDSGCQLGIEMFKYSVNSNGYTVPVYNELLFERNCSDEATTINIPDGKKAIWNRTIEGHNLPTGDYVVHAYAVGYEDAPWAAQNKSFVQMTVDVMDGEQEPSYDEEALLCEGTGGSYDAGGCSCPNTYLWSNSVGCQQDPELLEQCVEEGKFIGFSTEEMVCIDMGSMNLPLDESPFSDIEDHWGRVYIENLYVQGVIQGYEDGTFRPDEYVNRVELTKMALSAANIDPEEPLEGSEFSFKDVEGWQVEWVYPAWERDIVEGYSQTMFAPSRDITRAEALKIAMLAFDVDVPDTGNEWAFEDTIDHWAISYINQAYLDFIVSGKTDNLFYPNDPITRAETAKIINNLLNS